MNSNIQRILQGVPVPSILEAEMYVVKGTARGKKHQVISRPMSRKDAEVFKKDLEQQMKMAVPAYQWAKDLEVVPA